MRMSFKNGDVFLYDIHMLQMYEQLSCQSY